MQVSKKNVSPAKPGILLHGVMSREALNKISKGATVYICEGRPSLEAGKVNAKLLSKTHKPTIICDNMAGFLFFKGLVKEVVLACQFVDKSGALCDMGALILAVLAKKHKVSVKLVDANPKTRFLGDPKTILSFEGKLIAPKETHSYVPLVEWVPAKYLKKI
jgi:methylthioribose-1-phosphate isomerase